MRVGVTGATGFVGGHACRALVAAGHEVLGLARSVPADDVRVPGVTYVGGVDVTAAADASAPLADRLAGCDAVVHLVGIIAEVPSRGQTFERVHVGGTRNLVDAARRSGVSARFVYVSALGAAANAPSDYGRTKAAAEQIVRDAGIPFTIFRPSIILGPGAEFLEQIEALIRRPPGAPFPLPFVPLPGRGANRFQPVHVDDLTACIVRCLENPAAENQLYEIGGNSEVTFNALVEAVQRQIGVKKPLLHVPLPLMFPAAAALEALLPRPPVTTDQLLNLRQDNVCDNVPVRAAFGIDPLPFEQALDRVYASRAAPDR